MRIQRRWTGRGIAVILLACSCAGLCQKPSTPPTVEEILTRVHENYLKYFRSVPNLFADENLVSGIETRDPPGGSLRQRRLNVDSLFRLKREGDSAQNPGRLDEVRQIKAVDHRPADENTPSLPSVLNGAFTFGGSYLSPALERCYDYVLHGSRRWEGKTVFVVEYTDEKRKGPVQDACRGLEPLSGRAFVDSESMQVLHVEQSRPLHRLESGQYDLSPTAWEGTPPGAIATWSWSVDYAPVEINGDTFWLPKTITSKTESSSARWVRWSFQSEYSNYHLMSVHSVLLPAVSANPLR